MPTSANVLDERVWILPPLILHPFSERVDPAAMADNCRAGLMLAGLVPDEGSEREDLNRRYLAGRYSELRMLFFVGKDAFRWMSQCEEWAAKQRELDSLKITARSFGSMLTSNPPRAVRDKLVRWGVADYTSIFARAIGLNSLFSEPPACAILAEEFLRNYHHYADSLFRAYVESESHTVITPANFTFDLYASGEYSRMLEEQWSGDSQ